MKNYTLRNIIKRALQEQREFFTINESRFPRGEFNVTGVYNDVKPYYNFRSQGPVPGRIQGPGYDFISKGPEGVNYFMEEDYDEGPNPMGVCISSLGLEDKMRKDYTKLEKGKYEKCVLKMKKKLKENHIKRIIKRVVNEQENIASTIYTQDTSHRDIDTGKVIASTEMLDILNTKIDTLTDIVTDLYDNLSRRWT
tara:strand:+ start:3719 stop:4306 length:588 start_codon:yes stop_codon:yes gene_type:complete